MYGQDDPGKQGGNSKIDKPTLNQGYAKGGPVKTASYAEGGAVLGRTREFLKEPVEYREQDEGKRKNPDNVGDIADEDQKYGKSGPGKGKGEHAPPGKKWKSDIKQVTCK